MNLARAYRKGAGVSRVSSIFSGAGQSRCPSTAAIEDMQMNRTGEISAEAARASKLTRVMGEGG